MQIDPMRISKLKKKGELNFIIWEVQRWSNGVAVVFIQKFHPDTGASLMLISDL